MNIWVRIRKLSPSKLIGFGWILIRRPRLVIPLYRVTQRTMNICDEKYGNAHYFSGKANAFRHALWNYLLCHEFNKKLNDPESSIHFTERIVSHYEDVTQNERIQREMDTHNNQIGRDLFLSHLNENEDKMIIFIQNIAEKAQKVNKIEDFRSNMRNLVYVTNDC